ncbi:hypothetical protein H5410_009146 [Solanum commersonii]|uniref:Uncharacterized protein n=1 Tax=Solanum commersonii TaxID=4109 RepID=A0A9J6AH60_SOLCO|nr:hypothetical protein H5410_009146 [Solanum commersonii]
MSIFLGNTASRPLAFNAATNATSGQAQNVSMDSSTSPTFGKNYDFNSVANEPLVWSRDVNVSDSSILGYPRAPAFGVSSNSHFGTPRLDSYSFGQPTVSMSGSKGKESTPPIFKSYGFGKSAFGINRKGSRIASYIATPENNITGPSGEKIQSICGMQTYKDKSQEELRFEDYQLGDKGYAIQKIIQKSGHLTIKPSYCMAVWVHFGDDFTMVEKATVVGIFGCLWKTNNPL